MRTRNDGDEFLELGLLLIATGLTAVLITAILLFVFLESHAVSNSIVLLVAGSVVLGLLLLLSVLVRRLRRFLTGSTKVAENTVDTCAVGEKNWIRRKNQILVVENLSQQ